MTCTKLLMQCFSYLRVPKSEGVCVMRPDALFQLWRGQGESG